MGVTAILAQVGVLRLSYSGFYGNELVFGVVFACWLALSGLGSIVGGRLAGCLEIRHFAFGQMVLGFLALPTFFLIRIGRFFLSSAGEIVGLEEVFFYSLSVLAPFCILEGLLFPLAVNAFRSRMQASGIYRLEAFGSMSAAFVFSFIIAGRLDFAGLGLVVFTVNFFSAALILWGVGGHRLAASVVSVGVIISAAFLLTDIKGFSNGLLYPGQQVLEDVESRYGNIVVTRLDGQLNFFENGVPVSSAGDVFSAEEKTQYGLFAHPAAESMLLISGGLSQAIPQALKHAPKRLDYVELDPALVEAGMRHLPDAGWDDVNIHLMDGRLFLDSTNQFYDVVLVDAPDPDSLSVNRLYTVEFFRLAEKRLYPGGLVQVSVSGGENVFSPQSRMLTAVTYNTLKEVFNRVIVLPGQDNYFIASDRNLSTGYLDGIDASFGLEYIPFYGLQRLREDRQRLVDDALESSGSVNSDFSPVSMRLYHDRWMRVSGSAGMSTALFFFLVVFSCLFYVRGRPVPSTVFTTGFSAAVGHLLIAFGFQALHGLVYHKIGLLVGLFMAGLYFGAVLGGRARRASHKIISRTDAFLAGFFLVYGLLLSSHNPLLHFEGLFYLLSATLGLLVGWEFQLALKTGRDDKGYPGLLYGMDLAGASAGALGASILIVPVLGLPLTCLLLCLVNVLSSIYVCKWGG